MSSTFLGIIIVSFFLTLSSTATSSHLPVAGQLGLHHDLRISHASFKLVFLESRWFGFALLWLAYTVSFATSVSNSQLMAVIPQDEP